MFKHLTPCLAFLHRTYLLSLASVVVVDSLILDCTSYIHKHPGGASIIKGFGGQDCSWQWWTFHNRRVWNDVLRGLRVGRTEGVENAHERPSRAFVGLRGFGYQEAYE